MNNGEGKKIGCTPLVFQKKMVVVGGPASYIAI